MIPRETIMVLSLGHAHCALFQSSSHRPTSRLCVILFPYNAGKCVDDILLIEGSKEEGRSVYKVLVGKPEGKGPLGRPRHRWEDNIKMYLQEVGRSFGDWMELAQDRDRWRALVSTVMNLRVP